MGCSGAIRVEGITANSLAQPAQAWAGLDVEQLYPGAVAEPAGTIVTLRIERASAA